MLKLSTLIAKFSFGWQHNAQAPQPIHVHVHNSPPTSHNQAYSGWIPGSGSGGEHHYYYRAWILSPFKRLCLRYIYKHTQLELDLSRVHRSFFDSTYIYIYIIIAIICDNLSYETDATFALHVPKDLFILEFKFSIYSIKDTRLESHI